MLLSGARLICRDGFDVARVADIVSHGEASVGAFYQRFGDKHGLLAALRRELELSSIRGIRRFFSGVPSGGDPLRMLERLVVTIDRSVRRRRRLIAAMVSANGRDAPRGSTWQAIEEALGEALIPWSTRGRSLAVRAQRSRLAAASLLQMVVMHALLDPPDVERLDRGRVRTIVDMHARYLQ
ncbi:MAG TPA: TetR/AcrR family transcriptional regulator [Pseudomonadales bacterium]